MAITSRQPVTSTVLMQDSFNVVENINYAVTEVGSAAASTMTIGSVVVWDTDHFRLIANADVATLKATAASGLPNGVELAVVVGFDSLGDVYSADLEAGVNRKGVVLFRGLASVIKQGLVFGGDVSAPNQAIVITELEKQDIAVKNGMVAVSSNFYGEYIA